MAISHAEPSEVIDVRPFGTTLKEHASYTLFKTDEMEMIRLVLPKGKEIDTHSTPGPITIQCLEGRGRFLGDGEGGRTEAG